MLKLAFTSSAVAFAATLAFAQTGTPVAPSHGTLRHRAQDAEVLQALLSARVFLGQAIETAEGNGNGRAVDAEFKVERGTAQYEIKVLGADGKLVEHHVDASSGQVIRSESHPIEAFFTRLKPADVQSARLTLRQAVAVAEQKAGGKAAEAEIEHDGNALRYKLTVLVGGRTQSVKVGMDGQAVVEN